MRDRLGDDRLRLAELMAARLCHDLSGPLGALMNTLEMVTEDPSCATEALPLANDVAMALGRRLRLVRAAWGGAGAALGVADLRALSEAVGDRGKLTVDLSGLAPAGRFSADGGRLVLNLLMLAGESLPAGGVVRLSGEPAREVVVQIEGARAAWPVGLAGLLAEPARAWAMIGEGDGVRSVRGLQAPLTALIAAAGGFRLSLLMAGSAEPAPPLLMQPIDG
ncbi:MAG: hypothetical protein KGJ41_16680 [Rhodospirillales bacterium]|nr:hypothetical protein [Rhodospirillales bacterium]MDE2576928.1 hypothetical protein [Rhodospirillales bacterium]